MEGETHDQEPSWLHQDLVWAKALAQSLVGEVAADDLVQETHLASLRSGFGAGSLRGQAPRSWWHRVLTRYAARYWRSEKARRHRERVTAREEALPSAEELASRLEGQRVLMDALARLSEPFRSTILLRYSEGLTPKEIARRLEMPAGTVRWRLKAALDQLRSDLEQEEVGGRAWSVLLLPLLRIPAEPAATPSIIGLETLWVTWMMKNWTVAIGVLLSLLVVGSLGWKAWADLEPGTRSLPPSLELRESESLGPLDPGAATSRNTEQELKSSSRPERQRLGVTTMENSPAVDEIDASRTGWWLSGRILGIPDREYERTRLNITARNLRGITYDLAAGVNSRGGFEVDLAEIFEFERIAFHELRVRVNHPGFVEGERSWELGRAERQAGFVEGGCARFDWRHELEAPYATVQGQVIAPIGHSSEGLSVELIPVVDGLPRHCEAVDRQACSGSGEFRMKASEAGTYHVVAHTEDSSLLPAHVEVHLDAGETSLSAPMELEEGAVLEGQVLLNGRPSALAMNLQLRGAHKKLKGCRWHLIDGQYHDAASKRVQVHADGQVRITGASHGTYELSLESFEFEGERVSLVGSTDSILKQKVDLPAQASLLNFEFRHRLFHSTSGGSSLPYVRFQVSSEDGVVRQGSTADGARLALACSADGMPSEVEFTLEGFLPETRSLLPDDRDLHWETVDLSAARKEQATLVLHLNGDEQRSMEHVSILLDPLGEVSGSGSGRDAWRETQWRRLDRSIRIEGIPPGAYRLTLASEDSSMLIFGSWPDTASTILNVTEELSLSPGSEQTLQLDLRAGGRLKLAPIEALEAGETRLRFTLIDALGVQVDGHWITTAASASPGRFEGEIPAGLELFFQPPLAPGSYELRTWSEGRAKDAFAYPFDVIAGQIVGLELRDLP